MAALSLLHPTSLAGPRRLGVVRTRASNGKGGDAPFRTHCLTPSRSRRDVAKRIAALPSPYRKRWGAFFFGEGGGGDVKDNKNEALDHLEQLPAPSSGSGWRGCTSCMQLRPIARKRPGACEVKNWIQYLLFQNAQLVTATAWERKRNGAGEGEGELRRQLGDALMEVERLKQSAGGGGGGGGGGATKAKAEGEIAMEIAASTAPRGDAWPPPPNRPMPPTPGAPMMKTLAEELDDSLLGHPLRKFFTVAGAVHVECSCDA